MQRWTGPRPSPDLAGAYAPDTVPTRFCTAHIDRRQRAAPEHIRFSPTNPPVLQRSAQSVPPSSSSHPSNRAPLGLRQLLVLRKLEHRGLKHGGATVRGPVRTAGRRGLVPASPSWVAGCRRRPLPRADAGASVGDQGAASIMGASRPAFLMIAFTSIEHPSSSGHGWFRTTDLSRVKRALSR